MKLKNTLLVYILQFPLTFALVFGVHFLTGLSIWWCVPIAVILYLMYYVGETYRNDDFYQQSVLISNEGASNWNDGAYDFHTMNDILDEMLEKEEQKKIKAQKRKELIARMSDEDKELLGLK